MCRASPIRMENRISEGEGEVVVEGDETTLGMRPWVYQIYRQLVAQRPNEEYIAMMRHLTSNPSPSILPILTSQLDDAHYYNWMDILSNPAAVPLLLSAQDNRQITEYVYNRRQHVFSRMAANPNPEVIPLLRESFLHTRNLNEFILQLSQNPSQWAMEWLKTIIQDHPEMQRRNVNHDKPMFTPNDEDYMERISKSLSKNPASGYLLEAYLFKIDYELLSQNPALFALQLLEANPNKIDWRGLSQNPSPDAIRLLEANPHKIDWNALSTNPGAVRLIQSYPNRINKTALLLNPNPEVMPLNEANIIHNHGLGAFAKTYLFANPAIFADYVWTLPTTPFDLI